MPTSTAHSRDRRRRRERVSAGRPPGHDPTVTEPPPHVAGVAPPATDLARAATEFLHRESTPLLVRHSHRVFLWGALLARERDVEVDHELLHVAAAFHDVGLLAGHRSDTERFEIDGADAALAFLDGHGSTPDRSDVVWQAIALHTTPEVPRRMRPEIALLQAGVEYDVMGRDFDALAPDAREAVLAAHPRDGFKDGIVRAFHDGFVFKPATTFGTMNADVLARLSPGTEPGSFVDAIHDAPFPS